MGYADRANVTSFEEAKVKKLARDIHDAAQLEAIVRACDPDQQAHVLACLRPHLTFPLCANLFCRSGETPIWRPVLVLRKPDWAGEPTVVSRGSFVTPRARFCTTCKALATVAQLLPDDVWDRIAAKFAAEGEAVPVRQLTTLIFNQIDPREPDEIDPAS